MRELAKGCSSGKKGRDELKKTVRPAIDVTPLKESLHE